jgi:uncharacterized RDD family membrane protein YckC
MQAAEARAGLRAAEAATRVEAQAAAQAALENPQADEEHADEREVQRIENRVDEATRQKSANSDPKPAGANRSLQIRWEPDMPAFPGTSSVNDRNNRGTVRTYEDAFAPEHVIEEVEPAQPIPANLIEFPRELIATRRMRPRLAETQSGVAGGTQGQLSIFEVDSGSISTEPELPDTSYDSEALWSSYDWSAIEVDAYPAQEPERHRDTDVEETPALHPAPMHFRAIAITVDAALIVATVCGVAALAAAELPHPPSVRIAEICAAGAVILVSVLYQYLFLRLGWGTPGMRWAGISLCTFDDENPTREQLCGRWKAMLLSLLPMGLGMVWAIFDVDHMSWHDRLSRTYLRRC